MNANLLGHASTRTGRALSAVGVALGSLAVFYAALLFWSVLISWVF